ncbi:LysR family transcriptional regulator [Pantoea sp. B9002]|jgi:DNA-binding transcriptional LysR family regulator|uniref:LysR family transcriptional regulator n=1 Tax=Pantoea sp. B9002 TaxID=2726979 RepID=UPI0015A278FE|nr:LysR family transcriptional regulator [Pantoea sp. B9002]NWA61110.1 LysR family transcriptional regulator [Pantoea sp. B9002]
MKYSPESLEAFVQTVASGSFSAAARVLSKSQSTISNAIANLEDDLGFTLFDRSGRNPVLTEHGQRAFAQVQQILAASQRLDELAVRLSQGVEPRLSLAISDFWQADHHENLLNRFEVRYPDIDFECMIAEDADALDLIQAGRVHLGVVRAQPQLPPDLAVARLQVGAQMAIYLHQDHALSQLQQVSEGQLGELRHLRLNTWVQNRDPLPAGRVWSAPSYLLLLEMAEQGFGWSILPRWLVEQFGHQVLKELPVPGWPQHIAVDVVWSRRNPPGPAGRWMIDQLCAQQPD